MNAFDETQSFFQFMETEDTLSNMDFIKQATYWCRKYKEYAEESYQLMIHSLTYSEYEIAHRDYLVYKNRVTEIEEAAKTRDLILL